MNYKSKRDEKLLNKLIESVEEYQNNVLSRQGSVHKANVTKATKANHEQNIQDRINNMNSDPVKQVAKRKKLKLQSDQSKNLRRLVNNISADELVQVASKKLDEAITQKAIKDFLQGNDVSVLGNNIVSQESLINKELGTMPDNVLDKLFPATPAPYMKEEKVQWKGYTLRGRYRAGGFEVDMTKYVKNPYGEDEALTKRYHSKTNRFSYSIGLMIITEKDYNEILNKSKQVKSITKDVLKTIGK